MGRVPVVDAQLPVLRQQQPGHHRLVGALPAGEGRLDAHPLPSIRHRSGDWAAVRCRQQVHLQWGGGLRQGGGEPQLGVPGGEVHRIALPGLPVGVLKQVDAHAAAGAVRRAAVYQHRPALRRAPGRQREGDAPALIADALPEGGEGLIGGELPRPGEGAPGQQRQSCRHRGKGRLPGVGSFGDQGDALPQPAGGHHRGGTARGGGFPGAHQRQQRAAIGRALRFAEGRHRPLVTAQLAVVPAEPGRQPHQWVEPVQRQAQPPRHRPQMVPLPVVAELMGEHMAQRPPIGGGLRGEVDRRRWEAEETGGWQRRGQVHRQRALRSLRQGKGPPLPVQRPGKAQVDRQQPPAGDRRPCQPDQGEGLHRPGGSGLL